MEGLRSDGEHAFCNADQAAQALGIDAWEFHWDRLRRSPLDCGCWFDVMKWCDDARIGDVLALAEEHLPIEQIATGPADELGLGPEWNLHSCLENILRDLDRFAGQGARFVEAGLQSPVVRSRNIALHVLSEWREGHWPETMRPLLRQMLEFEPDEDVRERIRKVIAGEEIE